MSATVFVASPALMLREGITICASARVINELIRCMCDDAKQVSNLRRNYAYDHRSYDEPWSTTARPQSIYIGDGPCKPTHNNVLQTRETGGCDQI